MPNTSSITRRSQRHRHRRSLSRKRLRGYPVRRTRRWAKRKGLGRRGRSLRGGAVGGIRGCLVEGDGGKHRRGGVYYGTDEEGHAFVDIPPYNTDDKSHSDTLRITAVQLPIRYTTLENYINSLPIVKLHKEGCVFINLPELNNQPSETIRQMVHANNVLDTLLLPEGWTKHWSDNRKRDYFYNSETRKSIWTCPDLPYTFNEIFGIYAKQSNDQIPVYLMKINDDLRFVTGTKYKYDDSALALSERMRRQSNASELQQLRKKQATAGKAIDDQFQQMNTKPQK